MILLEAKWADDDADPDYLWWLSTLLALAPRAEARDPGLLTDTYVLMWLITLAPAPCADASVHQPPRTQSPEQLGRSLSTEEPHSLQAAI